MLSHSARFALFALVLSACGARSGLRAPELTVDAARGDASATPLVDPLVCAPVSVPEPTRPCARFDCTEACRAWAASLAPDAEVLIEDSHGVGNAAGLCLRGTGCTPPPHRCFCGRGPECGPDALCVRDTPDAEPHCRCIVRE